MFRRVSCLFMLLNAFARPPGLPLSVGFGKDSGKGVRGSFTACRLAYAHLQGAGSSPDVVVWYAYDGLSDYPPGGVAHTNGADPRFLVQRYDRHPISA